MTGKVIDFLEPVLVLGYATFHIVGRARQLLLIEAAQGLLYRAFVQIHEWIAIGFLVARVDQRIQ